MLKLSIVIVNFNAGNFLLECLSSVKQVINEADVSVYIIDNASSDDSAKTAKQEFPEFNFILNPENLGFGKGNNLALEKIKEGYILLLNPDTKLEKGVISKMLEFMEAHLEVGISTCKIVFPDGRLDLTAHRGFPTPWASFKYYFLKDDSLYHLRQMDMSGPHEVDAIAGAFMLTRADVLKKVGLFDEDYFLYAEDIDLCFRIKEAGFKVVYVPSVSIVHYKGVSSGLKKDSQSVTTADPETRRRSLDAFYISMLTFYKKQMSKKYPFFINWLVYLGINIKWWMAKRKLTV
ncbi:hypothetical protein A2631_02695 [Candidatus Daviesbacteria bacterium RIFCSPHIGHO2_01_FULL_44_29]|uniref:Glycosyltransferase 2-like domain-containing protein n=1 Tax=Candidatus Daviesbacteria bacterium RIFCSPHIGHO2_02_FULL_43_12 TaxID=1797776 RepID=A0A1F5KK40_9BACT|nr:MAG: hypothetical protein A2631_02695 [Candidatus Daviesbacteria bacterium RIFCSPHIGHO2_01_FULL_44_29]OGE41293.1 MAG: hypothetical protein A3D25_02090 [Candidatus Daviesbacteria bacterium RIFCSPHIGHO2_02_FULL_43_12]OGE69494.1 MAG: hypothetical protein A3B55_03830 [Candidatus Daviesbacteria bacterium RIFCSPLOWO2_01_FULL_43_15]